MDVTGHFGRVERRIHPQLPLSAACREGDVVLGLPFYARAKRHAKGSTLLEKVSGEHLSSWYR